LYNRVQEQSQVLHRLVILVVP